MYDPVCASDYLANGYYDPVYASDDLSNAISVHWSQRKLPRSENRLMCPGRRAVVYWTRVSELQREALAQRELPAMLRRQRVQQVILGCGAPFGAGA